MKNSKRGCSSFKQDKKASLPMLLLKLKLYNYRPHRLQLSHGLLTVQNYDQIVWNL